MPKKNYEERLRQLTAYFAIQYTILENYDNSIDTSLMLKEIAQPLIEAVKKRKERCIKNLEEMVKKTDERILELQRQNPKISDSENIKELTIKLKEIKKEYEKLSNT
ncbi:MAG: hypothetical protein QXX55_01355 [Candidatus Pacearchaeota archaeon]